mmetsp:Transcript_10058/g.15135  ORF Transcript_10058/g.15135 Transcript_10058/m.15135 type:complete len:384 (+) Transcript_10058:270-1421(+)
MFGELIGSLRDALLYKEKCLCSVESLSIDANNSTEEKLLNGNIHLDDWKPQRRVLPEGEIMKRRKSFALRECLQSGKMIVEKIIATGADTLQIIQSILKENASGKSLKEEKCQGNSDYCHYNHDNCQGNSYNCQGNYYNCQRDSDDCRYNNDNCQGNSDYCQNENEKCNVIDLTMNEEIIENDQYILNCQQQQQENTLSNANFGQKNAIAPNNQCTKNSIIGPFNIGDSFSVPINSDNGLIKLNISIEKFHYYDSNIFSKNLQLKEDKSDKNCGNETSRKDTNVKPNKQTAKDGFVCMENVANELRKMSPSCDYKKRSESQTHDEDSFTLQKSNSNHFQCEDSDATESYESEKEPNLSMIYHKGSSQSTKQSVSLIFLSFQLF